MKLALTVNVGRISYTKENGGNLGLNVRYPVTTNFEETIVKLKEYVGTHGFEVADYSNFAHITSIKITY